MGPRVRSYAIDIAGPNAIFPAIIIIFGINGMSDTPTPSVFLSLLAAN
jgi:hypothetical protein